MMIIREIAFALLLLTLPGVAPAATLDNCSTDGGESWHKCWMCSRGHGLMTDFYPCSKAEADAGDARVMDASTAAMSKYGPYGYVVPSNADDTVPRDADIVTHHASCLAKGADPNGFDPDCWAAAQKCSVQHDSALCDSLGLRTYATTPPSPGYLQGRQ